MSSGYYGVSYKINGHRIGHIMRLGKEYHLVFERCYEENTLEEIEKIDWQHVIVEPVRENYPACDLPEGYSFVVKDINYLRNTDGFEVILEVDKQYWGDVTPYQAQIAELTAGAAEKDSQLAAKDAELAQKESEITALQQDNQASSAVTLALVGTQITPQRAAELRPVIEAAAVSLSDGDAAKAVELFPAWAYPVSYAVGDRVGDAGKLYKCMQAHTSQEGWNPAATPAMWVVVDVDHAGTQDDPIPASRGMEYEYGKYYLDSEDGKTYLCERTGEQSGDKIVLQFMPHDLVGQYFVLAE